MKRHGFTLTELLVVVGILLALATISLAVYSTIGRSEQTRASSRLTQAAFLGIKSRAAHSKEMRGVRLAIDLQNPNLATGFVYTQPIQHDPYPAGSFTLERDASGNVTILRAAGQTDWAIVSSHFAVPGQIRLPASTGQWYQFVVQSPGVLQLGAPYFGPIQNPPPATIAANNISADIQFAFEVMPFHDTIPLASGCVIDLRYCSKNVQSLAATGTVDFIFSPRGEVTGPTGGRGAVFLCLRTLADATANLDPSDKSCRGDCLVVALNPDTGIVTTFNADLTDDDADGIVDDLFRFARLGRGSLQ